VKRQKGSVSRFRSSGARKAGRLYDPTEVGADGRSARSQKGRLLWLISKKQKERRNNGPRNTSNRRMLRKRWRIVSAGVKSLESEDETKRKDKGWTFRQNFAVGGEKEGTKA